MSARYLLAAAAAALIISQPLSQPAFADDHVGQELIPYEKFTLDNGLTLIVHQDRKAPIVSVNVWYHVGSRNETPGKTGYAHLFEHLMFQGSENSPGEYLELVDKVGATDLNGTTWFDRTNYYQTVPKGALDRILFLESDRMGHMLEAIDQAVLDEQRGVVQNEKRQGDNEPYAIIFERLLPKVFPPPHPYSWETIGSMEDLEAASLDDMREWFRTYYGPNNAVLVIAGDVDPQEVLERVDHWFGEIPPGPPIATVEEWIPRHDVERREIMQDRVPQERVYVAWTGPRWGTTDAHHMQLAVDVLATGKNSRLYERLVYREQIATDIEFTPYFFEIAGLLAVEASVKPGVDSALVEAAIREEIADLMENGPNKRELERVRTSLRAGFLRGIEKVGGRGGKSEVLARGMIYGDDPGYYRRQLADIEAASVRDVQRAATEWFGQAPYVGLIVPYEKTLAASTEEPDRSSLPEPAEPDPAVFPSFSSRMLDNGLELRVIQRDTVPVVEFNLIVDSGYAADVPEQAGVANLTMSMLDEGAGDRDALEISEELALLGAGLGTGAGLDTAAVTLSALSENLDESLELFADVALDPTFPEFELERLRAQYINAIRQEKTRPVSIALRLLPGLLYGDDHAYAKPLSGTGTEASIASLTRADLVNWHRTWFRPNNATLVVVGDTTMEAIAPRIEKLFNDWESGDVPAKNVATVGNPAEEVIYLIDKPEAEQSIIFASQLLVPMSGPDEVAIKAMNDVLGGQFAARINMNLREDKGWSYGARSLISATRAQRPFIAYAPVQFDKTKESLAEMRREIREIQNVNPPSAEELERVQRSRTLSLPGRWETNGAVLGALSELVSYDLPDDYWNRYAQNLNNLSLDEVVAAARDELQPDQLIWVVIGDRARIEAGLQELNIGKIRHIDADGNPVE
ncbi:MAG: insulinase family protein [Gammaproteobacteria bacterium]|nr:insulinase family protein [Gammaproteobacteria bacterium]NND54119.1 insulinase family protein [Gammaproteobacteria bacterium]